MAVEVLAEVPLAPPDKVGRYRVPDYLALPDEPRCELISGRLYLSPAPSVTHQVVVLELAVVLRRIAQRSGGLALVAPVDVVFAPHSVVQPDLVYVSAGRHEVTERHIAGPPDLVVEVVSPSSGRRDRQLKLRLYAEEAVPEVWIVDAEAEVVECLVHRGGRFEVVTPRGSRYRSPVLPELALDVAALWRRVRRAAGPTASIRVR